MERIKTEYENFFGSGGGLIGVGSLHVPSGRIVACDPFFAGIATPFSRYISPGQYEVQISVRDLPEWGPRTMMARLLINPNSRAHTFENADREFADSNRYSVESGLGCFMDEATCRKFAEHMARFYQANPDGNYYDDVLAKEFKNSADPTDPFDTGRWNMHVFLDPAFNVAMFSSGLGDGTYESFWVLDEHDAVVALVTDFNVE